MSRDKSVCRSGLLGLVAGALVGAGLIGIGLLRVLFSLFAGTQLKWTFPTSREWRLLLFYIGGFTLVGGLLGAVRIHERGRIAVVCGYMLGGALVMLAITAGDQGGLGRMDRADWIALPSIGALFGAAAAVGHLRMPRAKPPGEGGT